ncbi:hypothetical protein R1sor_016397 [Riccia sorocarpa]|uniref:Transposase n=1 Tax=Riccia sorocarpa TaxID=122646 RepID=A0ABD3HFA6_9MARC
MRLVVDSPAVRHVEQTWPEFGRDPRHLRFGLASDGKVKNIDIYLEPLVEELQHLWTGVDDVYDGRTERIGRDRWFKIKGVLLWTMHDYPGFAQVLGFQTSRYAACPTCGPALPMARSSHMSKQVYMSYFTYLPLDDPLRGTGAERNTMEPPIPLDMNWWA